MATFHGKQTSKDRSIKKTLKKESHKNNKNDEQPINRIPAIRVFAVRVTPIFTNKKHALNTLKMGLLLS
jgi:hypothetical protein